MHGSDSVARGISLVFLATKLVCTAVAIEFDPGKDVANIAKHGISLSRAADMAILAFTEDNRVEYGDTAIAHGV
jgi:hypothetical protein